MAGEYDDILAAAVGDDTPRRTRKGALKYQPADTDWSLDRLPELQDFYQSTYKRPLPVTVKGQGSIHNKWGYDHRASADISLNPTTPEGQALITELQRRRIPFLAFDRAIPGSSTNPHIHVGRPSHRTSARYGIGAQVKGSQRKAPSTVDTYDDILAAAVGEVDQTPTRQSAQPAQPTLDPLLHQLGRINDASDPGAPAGIGELRRIEGREQREAADTGVGRLRQLDDPEAAAIIANRKYVEGEVRRQRQSGAGAFLGPLGRGLELGVRDPYAAASDVLTGRTEEQSIAREVDQRIQTSREDTERLREIRQQFTDEDRAMLAAALDRMRGQGSVNRGIETGAQRVGSGLLYKLAGLADAGWGGLGGLGLDPTKGTRTQLGDYLRRQAGRGELSIMQIEAEMPPDLRQQFADFATHAVGALPEILGATAAAGPVGGFAALGGLEAVGRKESFADVAKETAKGAVLGAVFKGAGAVETLPGRTLGQRAVNTAESGLAIGAGTYAVEKAFGADDYSAARSAASNVFLHAALRVPGEVARFTTAAERALKSPVEEPVPTVPADLQARLARAEEGRPTDTTPLATELKTPTIPPAEPSQQLMYIQGLRKARVEQLQEAARASDMEAARELEFENLNRPTQVGPPIPFERSVPPADMTSRPVPAEPAVVGLEPATAPTRPVDAAYLRERIPEKWRGVPFTGEGLERQLGTQIPSFRALEQQGLIRRTEDGHWLVDNRVYGELHDATPPTMRDLLEQQSGPAEEPITRRPLADALRTRMEAGPREAEPAAQEVTATKASKLEGELDRAQDFQGRRHLVTEALADSPLRSQVLEALPKDAELAGPEGSAPEMQFGPIRFRTPTGEVWELDLAYNHRKDPGWKKIGDFQDGFAVRKAEAKDPINLITGKPVKGRPENEGGFVRVDEIAKAIRKVADTATGKKGERRVEYVLSQPGGRKLAISIDIDRRGVARPFIGPQERLRPGEESLLGGIGGGANPDVSGAKPLNLGVDTLLALKRYLMQVHPEITRVEFNRAGSTGGVVGREVKLRPVPRTTPERPAGPAPPRSVDLEAVRTQLARRGLEIREADAPIPTFVVVRGGREIAKFASADRARALESLDEYAKRGEGQEGFIDIAEIARGIRKLRDMTTENSERAVRYAYRLPGGRELGVNLTIDKQGVAYTQVRPLERQGRDFVLGKEKLDVGVETLLGLKRYLLQTHPEITQFKFRGEGGGLATLTPVRRSSPEPVQEANLDAVRSKLATSSLELREATSPIPTFTVVNAQGREVAKFANRDRNLAARNLEQYAGVNRPKAPAPDFEQRQRLNRTELDELAGKGFDSDSLAYYNRTDPIRLKRLYTDVVIRSKEASAADQQDIGPVSKPPRDQGGYIDLNEIREGVRAGKVKIEEALAQLKLRYPSRPESQLRPLLNRQHDPLIGLVKGETVSGASGKDLFRELEHSEIAGWVSPDYYRWRYEPSVQKVYWTELPTGEKVPRESMVAVENYLARQGQEVVQHEELARWRKDVEQIKEAESRPPVHHSTAQPRTDTGQFSPGEPGGMEAARSQLRTEARKYATDYKRLDLHLARREGLDIVNDGVARNYFTQLRRLTDEFLPAQSTAVDRAETLYNQGKYGQATMLAESVFRSLPDKVNEYAGADAAIQLTQMGKPSKADWTKTLQEVRERLKRTGGLSGGGSTFYDVNKYPEGGRPDHAKIAYILEPVVDALKMDAQRLIAEGKLKAADYVAHVRKAVNDMLAREEFSDWHPLNKSAALGVLVDKLRQEGPPAAPPRPLTNAERLQALVGTRRTGSEPPEGPPPTQPGEPTQPSQRQRSLPKTLAKSGRDPGTDTTFDRLPNEVVNRRVEGRLEAEGADALESWYRSAPESADRVAAHRVLVDHYTARSIELVDTAPQQAAELMQRARDLSNLEDSRSTTIGQAMQMYSNLLKYTAPGVLREVSRLEAQGAKVPAELAQRLVKAAKEAEATDKEVRRLERKLVEAEGQEAPEPVEVAAQPSAANAATRRARRIRGAGPAEPEAAERGPRRYRPRTNAPDTPAERIRRQLDETAQRRRAQRLAIAAQLRAIEQQRTLGGYWKRAMNITRGLMVSAFSTAMRNLQSQALRFDIERLDDLVEHTIRKSIGLESDLTYRNVWRNTARQFKFSQTAEAREILASHEGEYHRMFNTYAGGVDVPIPHPARARTERVFQTVERAVEIANFANRVQEFHVRSAEFLAELDLHLRKEHNQTLEQYVRRNGIDAIPLELAKKATDKALEVTFADMPSKDGAGGRLVGSLIEIGNYIPPTVSPVAFPRFMYNNLKFLYQHSPAGMLDLARRGQNRPRVIARSLVGTSMLLLAYQFRSSDHAGEKWYELKFGDTTLDARPFGPFSTYLFLAEAIRRAKSGEKQFTLDELAQTLGASVLGSGTGTALLEKLYNQIVAGEWEKLQRTLKTEGGEWGRALLTPVRQVKDLIGAFDASQAVNRDTSESPFLGPIQESIPYADTGLPPAQLPTTATPIHQERPATKAITGWRAITPKTFLQRQLDELNFTSAEVLPATGNPTLDALQKRLMGPLMDELSTELERDTEFKGMTKKARAVFLRDAIEQIREEVREAAAAEQPELHEKYQEERKPRRTREFEQELNSPGLSRALQLGVPMPIPPRRPGEDDIAYRARLLQVGRQRRSRLDSVAGQLGSLDRGSQRSLLHSALYRG